MISWLHCAKIKFSIKDLILLNPQEIVDFVTFTEEILKGNFNFFAVFEQLSH